MKNNASPAPAKTEQPKNKMSSIEIADVSGRMHKDVLKAIRNMEAAWEKVNGRKFAPVDYHDAKGEKRPMYELDVYECMYIATKFNDEARAKLIMRWKELETTPQKQQLSQTASKPINQIYSCKLGGQLTDCYFTNGEVFTRFALLLSHLGNTSGTSRQLREKLGEENFILLQHGKVDVWYGNYQAFTNYLKATNRKPDFRRANEASKGIWEIPLQEPETGDQISYSFTTSEMLHVFKAIAKVPIDKNTVIALLERGEI